MELFQRLFSRTNRGLKITNTGDFLVHLLAYESPSNGSYKIGRRFCMDVGFFV